LLSDRWAGKKVLMDSCRPGRASRLLSSPGVPTFAPASTFTAFNSPRSGRLSWMPWAFTILSSAMGRRSTSSSRRKPEGLQSGFRESRHLPSGSRHKGGKGWQKRHSGRDLNLRLNGGRVDVRRWLAKDRAAEIPGSKKGHVAGGGRPDRRTYSQRS